MATKSFLKTVTFQNKKQSQDFIRALERSERKATSPVQMSRPVSNMTREEMRELFGAKKP